MQIHLNATSDAASVFPLHCKDFVDTDFNCLVTAQMSYYSNSLIKCKNLAQKIMDTLKKKKKHFIKVKYPENVKTNLNLLEKINFYLTITQYEEYQKL